MTPLQPKNISAQLIASALQERGAQVSVVAPRFNLLQVTHQEKSFFVKSTAVPINPHSSCVIANNKFLTKKVLRRAKIDVPKSFLARSAQETRQIIREKSLFPCVVKPISGAHGNAVYVNVESETELDTILPKLFTGAGNEVIIEEYIVGQDYRVFVTGDHIPAVMERIPAHVIGDGSSTIRQLVAQCNQHPLVGKKYEKPMCKIRFDAEAFRLLKKHGWKVTSVPRKGEVVYLRLNANISTGGIGKDVTETVPEKVKAVALAAARELQMRITGADVLYDPVNDRAVVLEINDVPGIDIHHFPVVGKARDVAGAIADELLRENA